MELAGGAAEGIPEGSLLIAAEEWYKEMLVELEAADSGEGRASGRLAECIRVVRRYLERLRALVERYGFGTAEEEVAFFKEVKPRFYQWLIFHAERFALRERLPAAGGGEPLEFYRKELEAIQGYFERLPFHYAYYRLGAKELDHLYFIRGAMVQEVLLPEVPEVDPAFGTRMDYLFSKFMALERLREHVAGLLGGEGKVGAAGGDARPERLKWTGELINLVELGYGVHLTGQVGEGKLGIVEWFRALEEFFGVKLGVPKKGLDDLSRRKRLSKTRFLEQMQQALLDRMEAEDAYDPQKAAGKKWRF